ncbi:hypothetical protein Sa4125_42800 [Aureimonas sp. SA4125]|uniref:DUF934 domain-containing protein n=1 Tax=Aureimonas sp. SA4125 TaxID=2826993 RepID=UPI001CC6762D|nr:DUF934 domain-containing protein [Aureimonas sp. SA4125]BDA86738.1 hypothetical protein Sa4125_42800 [Aureimonas sp. SA4125]
MSMLVGPGGAKADLYTPVEDAASLSLVDGPILVGLTVIDAALADRRNERLGLVVANDTPITAIEPYFGSIDLIAITFPSFSDGRGLSLSRRLRRAGFAGTLRVRGPIVADQFAEALACGFDEVEVPDAMAARQPLDQWLGAKDIVTDRYQGGYGEGESILQKRRAARQGAGSDRQGSDRYE